jgi:hypothetical protein
MFLHQFMLHSMARALYGAQRFADSLEVYGWIPPTYPRYRQVLFEKMWAAFRHGRLDIALGAIASQHSAYFSEYQEPETYLVQVYVFKKLCRDQELERVRNMIKKFKSVLMEPSHEYGFREWAKSDLETFSLLRLTEITEIPDADQTILDSERLREKNKINKLLRIRFENERKRLAEQLKIVLAYSYVAIGADSLAVKNYQLPSRAELMKHGSEFWLVRDGENWVDELGGHLYIGDSRCKEKNN